jgi:hypothetical protein
MREVFRHHVPSARTWGTQDKLDVYLADRIARIRGTGGKSP